MRSQRTPRQFVESLTDVTRETVVALVLEDLQWSDGATVETLAYLARYPDPLRLLVPGHLPARRADRSQPSPAADRTGADGARVVPRAAGSSC